MSLRADVLTMVHDPLLSVRVVAPSGSTRGLLDDQESVVGTSAAGLEPGETMLRRERVLHLAAQALPALTRKQTIQVGAIGDDDTLTTYRVRDIRRTADGLVWEVLVVA